LQRTIDANNKDNLQKNMSANDNFAKEEAKKAGVNKYEGMSHDQMFDMV
jgi:hypothetical protein